MAGITPDTSLETLLVGRSIDGYYCLFLRFRWSRLSLPLSFASSRRESYITSFNKRRSSSNYFQFIDPLFGSQFKRLAMIASYKPGSSSSSTKSSDSKLVIRSTAFPIFYGIKSGFFCTSVATYFAISFQGGGGLLFAVFQVFIVTMD